MISFAIYIPMSGLPTNSHCWLSILDIKPSPFILSSSKYCGNGNVDKKSSSVLYSDIVGYILGYSNGPVT